MLFAPSVCKGGLRSHFNLISDGREPAREVAGKIAERHGGIMAAEFEKLLALPRGLEPLFSP
jgi:hypothetical protein